MRYSMRYTEKAIQSLKKLDRSVLILIKSWIEKNLVDTDDPRHHGKGLTSNRSGQWRYRVGNYRILAEIEDKKLIILVIEVGHRNSVYKA
ncbi:type II toxin-antitoxin system RelE family toxin [Stomatobaculum longum]